MKLTSTSERVMSYVRALLIGDSGTGKTTSLRTLPEAQTLIVALERGLLPLRSHSFRVVQIESWQDMRELYEALLGGEVQTDGSMTVQIAGESLTGLRILAVDSLTELNMLAKRQILDVDRRKLVSERTKGKRDNVEGIYDEQLTPEDWNVLGTRMASLVSAINHLPLHTVFTSLATWKEDKRTGIVHRIPALNGGLATDISGYFDLVLHMESSTDAEGNSVRVWRTANNGTVLAKDASGALDEFEEPNWSRVFAKILKGKQPNA